MPCWDVSDSGLLVDWRVLLYHQVDCDDGLTADEITCLEVLVRSHNTSGSRGSILAAGGEWGLDMLVWLDFLQQSL